ncbi:MAG: rhomboid family intramembrane serine protease [Chitinophagaceae bacterium]
MTQFGIRESLPPVVKNLLIANVLVFLAQFVFEQQGFTLEPLFALHPIESGDFRIWQLVTHMFMHGGFFHILFNMFGLWMFGSILENYWGSKRFFQFYIICGLVAGAAHLTFSNGSAIGASGAVMGVFAAFAYLFPNTPLFLMFIPIPIKAKWAMPGLILIDVFGAIAPRTGDNIAHWAHIGGALAGLCLVLIWNKKNRKTFY